MKSDKSPERVEETAPENKDMIPVHINRRDRQAAKAYVEGYNSGLETAAYVLENGNFLTSESLAYLWAHQVAALVRARKTLEPPEPVAKLKEDTPISRAVGEGGTTEYIGCGEEFEDRSRPMTTNKSASPASSNPPTGINGGYDALNQLSREQAEEIVSLKAALRSIVYSLSPFDEELAIQKGRALLATDSVSVTINTQHELYKDETEVPGGVHKLEAEIIRLKAEIAALREANTVATSVADTLRREIQELHEEAKNEKS